MPVLVLDDDSPFSFSDLLKLNPENVRDMLPIVLSFSGDADDIEILVLQSPPVSSSFFPSTVSADLKVFILGRSVRMDIPVLKKRLSRFGTPVVESTSCRRLESMDRLIERWPQPGRRNRVYKL